MNDILKQLSQLAQTKDSQTCQQILHIRALLAPLLEQKDVSEIEQVTNSVTALAISPDDISKTTEMLPEVASLVKIVKTMLINQSNGSYFNVKQKTIVEAWKRENPWIDFSYTRLDAMERIYRLAGWKVDYDSPGYNESYDANFTFNKKK